MLFVRAEALDAIYDFGQQSLAREVAMLLEGFDQTLLAKFVALLVAGLSDAIGVERKHVSGRELVLAHGAIPFSEEPEQRAGGIEAIHFAVASYQEA